MIDELLLEADPARGLAEHPRTRALVAEIVAATPLEARRSARLRAALSRQSKGRKALLVGAAVLAIAGTAAASAPLLAHTGLFGEPGMTENDTSEWLRSDAADFRQVVSRLTPTDIPLPTGKSFQANIDHQVDGGLQNPGLIQVTGVRASFAFYSSCLWQREWLAAFSAGQSSRAAHAVEVLRAVPTWPILIAVDGGGVADLYRRNAEAAARGDASVIRAELANSCSARYTGGDQ